MACGTKAWLLPPAPTQIPAPLGSAPAGVSAELEEKEEEAELTMLGNLTLLWLGLALKSVHTAGRPG